MYQALKLLPQVRTLLDHCLVCLADQIHATQRLAAGQVQIPDQQLHHLQVRPLLKQALPALSHKAVLTAVICLCRHNNKYD